MFRIDRRILFDQMGICFLDMILALRVAQEASELRQILLF